VPKTGGQTRNLTLRATARRAQLGQTWHDPHAASRCRTDNTSGICCSLELICSLADDRSDISTSVGSRSHQHSRRTAYTSGNVGWIRSLVEWMPNSRAPRSSSSPAPSDGICSQRATSKFEGPRRRSCPMLELHVDVLLTYVANGTPCCNQADGDREASMMPANVEPCLGDPDEHFTGPTIFVSPTVT